MGINMLKRTQKSAQHVPENGLKFICKRLTRSLTHHIAGSPIFCVCIYVSISYKVYSLDDFTLKLIENNISTCISYKSTRNQPKINPKSAVACVLNENMSFSPVLFVYLHFYIQ